MLEDEIAYHCGPTLAGIKPANIFSSFKKQNPEIKKDLHTLNQQLNKKDIFLKVICECKERVLIMVYKGELLNEYLHQPEIEQFLRGFGYNSQGNVEECIDYLISRLTMEKFPHEIGAFLGYPLSDILGFINHKDDGCLYTGEWKVYSNVEEAKKMFCIYKRCRSTFLNKIRKGYTLAEVLQAS